MLDAQKTLMLDVAESYYQVLRTQALIEVLKKSFSPSRNACAMPRVN